ncbi:MAG: hypothetical protein R3250_05415, partial [Melioribacteraceae bacterium]|nr:hypothetical protein [Melioribacteraceae bacterium]
LIQRTDPGYATRAGTNNVHFLLSLNNVSTDLNKYLTKCIEEGVELNGVAAYPWFHYNALIMAFNYFSENLNSKEKQELILKAMAHEAFALHFLQDMFAAGHVAGTWGDASQRKGTHDYYNEKGLEAITWQGENIIITGDAYMRSQDAQRAAEAVGISLRQFIDAAYGIYDETIFNNQQTQSISDELNVCEINFLPLREFSHVYLELEKEILLKTPRPGLVSGLGEMPRFRAELGLFTGFSPSLNGTLISGGFGASQKTIGAVGGIEATIRIGFGLDGVLNESGDGLIFFGFGWREDGASSIGVVDQEGTQKYGNILAAVPGRSAFSFRLRIPFYLLPADIILLGPILMFISPESLTHMAVIAANGGLIPWHSGIATPFGRFLFVLGREISTYLYGRSRERDAVLFIDQKENGDIISGILSYRSTKIEFPILEYRPFKSFSFDQSSGLLLQLFGGVDIPHNVAVLDPLGVQKPKLKNIWYGGIRLVFDWRHYF